LKHIHDTSNHIPPCWHTNLRGCLVNKLSSYQTTIGDNDDNMCPITETVGCWYVSCLSAFTCFHALEAKTIYLFRHITSIRRRVSLVLSHHMTTIIWLSVSRHLRYDSGYFFVLRICFSTSKICFCYLFPVALFSPLHVSARINVVVRVGLNLTL